MNTCNSGVSTLTCLVIIINPNDTSVLGLKSTISLGNSLQYALSDANGVGVGAIEREREN